MDQTSNEIMVLIGNSDLPESKKIELILSIVMRDIIINKERVKVE